MRMASCNATSLTGQASISASAKRRKLSAVHAPIPRMVTSRFWTSGPDISARAAISSRPLIISSAIPIRYSALRRDRPAGISRSGVLVAQKAASVNPASSMRAHMELAAARDTCWPTIARASVSKLAGSDLSGGGPYVCRIRAISASRRPRASNAPPSPCPASLKSLCCMSFISVEYQLTAGMQRGRPLVICR